MTDPARPRSPRSPLPDRLWGAFLLHVLRFPPNSRPAPSFEYRSELAEEYDNLRKGRAVFNWEEEIVGELLKGYAPGSRILDVPVGTGRFIPTYTGLGLEVVGLDASADMLQQAAKTFDASARSVTLVEGSATDLPFPDDDFDALVSFRFLPGKLTLRQTRRALREFARVTRGTCFLLLKIGDRAHPPSWRDAYSRLGTRPEEELRAILASEGFDVEQIHRAPVGPKAVFVCRPR
jgi:SAM-dependent methyltransferase